VRTGVVGDRLRSGRTGRLIRGLRANLHER
jgi:hypothetical protein